MSKLPQGFCFPEELKSKLENPSLSLEAWTSSIESKAVAIKVKASNVKLGLNGKTSMFTIAFTDAYGKVQQQDKELIYVKLEGHLSERFPGAFIPPFPKANPLLYEHFLRAVAENAFLRSDASFIYFMDESVEKYKKRKFSMNARNSAAKGSQGRLRWLQALSESADHTKEITATKLNQVKAEFDRLYKNLSNVNRAMNLHVEKLIELAKSSKEMERSLNTMLASEKNVNKVNGTAFASYDEVGDILHETVNLCMKQAGLVTKEYGAAIFSKRITNPLLYDTLIVASWKKHVGVVVKKMELLDKLRSRLSNEKNALELSEKQSSKKGKFHSQKLEKLEEAEKAAYIEFYQVVQGVFGVELERFKIRRTKRNKELYDALRQFHLVGADRIRQIWDPSGDQDVDLVYIDEDFDAFFEQGRLSQRFSLSSGIMGKNRSNRETINADKTVTLKAVNDYVSKKSKFLSLEAGEILTAQRQSEDLWLAINKKGKEGFVNSENVVLNSAPSSITHEHSKVRTNSVPPGLTVAPPGLGPPFKPHKLKHDGNFSDAETNGFEEDEDKQAIESAVSAGKANKQAGSSYNNKAVIKLGVKTNSKPEPPPGAVKNDVERKTKTESENYVKGNPSIVKEKEPVETVKEMMQSPPPILPPGALLSALKNPNLKAELKSTKQSNSGNKTKREPPARKPTGNTLMQELTATLQKRKDSINRE